MMTMQTKNQLLFTMISRIGGYHLKSKKEKGRLLSEYCKITGQVRKGVIRKIKNGKYIKTMRKEKCEETRKRAKKYGQDVVSGLISVWRIFDKPCGQRLQPLIRDEMDRLISLGEIKMSYEVLRKIKEISARSIDYKLSFHKEKERLGNKYKKKIHPLLYQKIPVKLSHEQGRGLGETIQIDMVEHCGVSPKGRFINTVSTTDIGTGWWSGRAIFGKDAKAVHQALYLLEKEYPFPWREIHPDNGSEFINETIWNFTKQQNITFSRSRPYRKNDNCFIEQKNSTHVRKIVGHQRYDTAKELDILNNLYLEDLAFYKNFFQPIIPLKTKERIAGRLKRTYGEAKTPYQNVVSTKNLPKQTKLKLTKIYKSLNPAELKRRITEKQNQLFRVREQRENEKKDYANLSHAIQNNHKLTNVSVTN